MHFASMAFSAVLLVYSKVVLATPVPIAHVTISELKMTVCTQQPLHSMIGKVVKMGLFPMTGGAGIFHATSAQVIVMRVVAANASHAFLPMLTIFQLGKGVRMTMPTQPG